MDVRFLIPPVVFLLVFNFFWGGFFLPLDYSKIPDRTPITYGYLTDLPDFYTCKVDRKGGYSAYVFWWYWPDHRKPDWEPVIVIYEGDRIHSFHTRIHWVWRSKFTNILAEDNKAIVSLVPETHTPLNTRPLGDMNRIDQLIKLNMAVDPPPEADLPSWDEVWSMAMLSELPSQSLENGIRYGVIAALITAIPITLLTKVKK